MSTLQSEPRIYVACLASYNAGILHGRWIDLDGTIDADDIQADVTEMLAASSQPGAEEWAIHDHEGFLGLPVGESTSFADIAAMSEVLTGDDDDAIRGLVWLVTDRGHELAHAIDVCGDVRTFTSTYPDLAADYAEELASEVVEDFDKRSSSWPFNCIDWERAGRELTLGGDIDIAEVAGERFVVTNAADF